MSKGTSNLVKAKAKLAVLEKAEAVLKKAFDKATAAYEKAQAKTDAQRMKVGAMTPTPLVEVNTPTAGTAA